MVSGLLLVHALHFSVLGRQARGGAYAVLATFAFNAALAVGWRAAGLNHPHYLLVPLGLSALVLLNVFARDLAPATLQRLRAWAVTVIYAAAAFEPLAMPTTWALWLCALVCVLGVAAGIVLRVRSYVFLGTGSSSLRSSRASPATAFSSRASERCCSRASACSSSGSWCW